MPRTCLAHKYVPCEWSNTHSQRYLIHNRSSLLMSMKFLPPTAPVLGRRKFWSACPRVKEAVCSLHASQEPAGCRIVCLVQPWEGGGLWAGLYISAVNGGKGRYFRRGKCTKYAEVETCLGFYLCVFSTLIRWLWGLNKWITCKALKIMFSP